MLVATHAAARQPVSYGYSLGGGYAEAGRTAIAPATEIRKEAPALAYVASGPIITPVATSKEEEYKDYSVSFAHTKKMSDEAGS